MTAQRWWVRLFARWQARIDSVTNQLNLLFTAMTGVGVISGVLELFGLRFLVVPFILLTGVFVLVYSYYFFEGGVKNQVARDRQDMSSNFIAPNGAIQAEANMRAWLAAQKERELTDEEREAIRNERRELFEDLRDGIEIGD